MQVFPFQKALVCSDILFIWIQPELIQGPKVGLRPFQVRSLLSWPEPQSGPSNLSCNPYWRKLMIPMGL